MKLDYDQAVAVLARIDRKTVEGVRAHQAWLKCADGGYLVDNVNKLLAEGEPHLTKIVARLMVEKLQ